MFRFGIFSLYAENLGLMFLYQFSFPVWALISCNQFDGFYSVLRKSRNQSRESGYITSSSYFVDFKLNSFGLIILPSSFMLKAYAPPSRFRCPLLHSKTAVLYKCHIYSINRPHRMSAHPKIPKS